MKVSIVTTTIHVPEVLALHSEYYSDASFYITGDKKTPENELRNFLKAIPNAHYYSPEEQEKLGYACSGLIGWNTIQRRNIALLEAIKAGSDVIVIIDDDNIPLSRGHVSDMCSLIDKPFSGCLVNSDNRWVDTGRFLVPGVIMRGLSWGKKNGALHYESAVRKDVGVVYGLSIGDPDINASEWLVKPPYVTGAWELMNPGLLVSKEAWCPFNSQNTAWRRELFPLMFLVPFVGKYDDIWGSYIAERIMRETQYYLYFGKPFSLQARNDHNYIHDLETEMLGIKYTQMLCDRLDEMAVTGSDVNAMLEAIFSRLSKQDFFPSKAAEAGLAWCKDIQKVWR
jgi:hypothetical protein